MNTTQYSDKHHSGSEATSTPVSSKHGAVSMTTSVAESISSQESLAKRFGSLLDITDESIISLALKVRNQVSSNHCKPSSKHRLTSRLNGSFNLVSIIEFDDGVKYVVRIPGTGWGDRFTDQARKSLESQIMTLRLIRNRTTIPVPEIYAFDASLDNELGAPWMVMSFISGSTISKLWFDKDGPTPLEERRQRTLETIAEAISQLQKFQFSKIGSLELTDQTKRHNKIPIGPLYSYGGCSWDDYDEEDDGEKADEGIKVDQTESFDSSMSYMTYDLPSEESFKGGSDLDLGAFKLNKMMLFHLPRSSSDPYSTRVAETFVLNFPDFDSQNILIDEKGNLTGLIDWDNAQTYPRFLGYCCYPGFINRDWDPMVYGYPESENENSPEELARYRQMYFDKMSQLLKGKDDVIFIAKSHIFEALQIATFNGKIWRLNFMREFVRRILPEQSDLLVLGNLAREELEPEVMEALEKGIKELLSVQPLQRKSSLPSLSSLPSFLGGFLAFFRCGRKRVRRFV